MPGSLKNDPHVLGIPVDGARHERGVGSENEGQGFEGHVHRAHRRGLRSFAELARGRILALGQSVDLVVEEHDFQIDVSPDRVDQVVSADREPVSISCDHPHAQIGVRDLEACRDRRRSTVEGVKPVGIHVVGEAAGAADTRDHDRLVEVFAELGKGRLHRIENAVVTTSRAPADVLV